MGFALKGFLRYAGAPSVREMRKTQSVASEAMRAGEVYEKPLDSPDRPSNVTRPLRDGTVAIPADLPQNILASAEAEGQRQRQEASAAQEATVQGEALTRGLSPESPGGALVDERV
ncbi:hypothetical protein JCM15519_29940 [Fundidesulfovibrio butyratiphilus]